MKTLLFFRGRFSVIAKCLDTQTNQILAAKITEIGSEDEASRKRELEAFRALRHERLPFIDSIFEFNGLSVIVMEKLRTDDVLTYLASCHQYSEQEVATIVDQVKIEIRMKIHMKITYQYTKFVSKNFPISKSNVYSC